MKHILKVKPALNAGPQIEQTDVTNLIEKKEEHSLQFFGWVINRDTHQYGQFKELRKCLSRDPFVWVRLSVYLRPIRVL